MSVLKYTREDHFLESIEDKVDELMETVPHYSKYHLTKQMHIYNLTRPALKVNHLEDIKKILKKIKLFFHDSKHDIDKLLRIYINRAPTPMAQAASTNLRGPIADHTRFYVILTQHFMNELSFKEQLAVIAHEYAHHYFRHTRIPFVRIRKQYYPRNTDDKMFILNLKKWGICREISADLCALQVTRCYESSALALIKFATGVTKHAKKILIGLESYFKKLKNHYHSDVLKEHPTTLLRVLILKKVYEYCQKRKWDKKIISDDIQNIIDDQIMLIYPEIIHEKNKHNMKIIVELGMLVSIADGRFEDEEMDYLQELINSQKLEFDDFEKYVETYKDSLNAAGENAEKRRKKAQQIIKKRIPRIIKDAFSLKQNLHISSIIRNLLTLASADGKIDSDELNVIYLFAKKFKYSKEDIVQQMFNLK